MSEQPDNGASLVTAKRGLAVGLGVLLVLSIVAAAWRYGAFEPAPDTRTVETAPAAPVAGTPTVETAPAEPVAGTPLAETTPTEPPPPPLPPPRERLKALLEAAGVAYPPRAVVLAAFKEERLLEIYARGRKGVWRLVHTYPVLGASGRAGPKLKEGDHQVPEGVYEIESLHPKSKYHLALRVNYPNGFDRKMAAAEKRKDPLGGDIMIHGGMWSIGCLAMGDPAIEEIYLLAETVKLRNIKVVISPFDIRRKPSQALPQDAPWMKTLYATIAAELAKLPVSPEPGATTAGK